MSSPKFPAGLPTSLAVALAAAACVFAAGCSSLPMPEIPSAIRERPEPIEPEVAAQLFADIETERGRLVAAQAAAEAACYQRFVVNSCLLSVRASYRPQLAELNHRDVAVRAGERERQERERLVRVEAQRQQSLQDRARTEERAQAAVPQAQRQADLDRRNAEREASQPGNAARAQANRSSAQAAHDKAVAEQAQRAAAAPGERAQYEQRQKAAAERRAAQARRAEQRKDQAPAQPLPATPGPASAPVQTP